MHYFAYGSNMLSARLEARIDIISCHGRALLPGYALCCDKISLKDHSAKFTLQASHGDQVYGVLYVVSHSALDRLDAIEGDGYQRIHVEIDAAGLGMINAVTYMAHAEHRDPTLKPYDWYRALAVAGAIEHDLPLPYIHHLQNLPVQVDPDSDRDTNYRALINSPSL